MYTIIMNKIRDHIRSFFRPTPQPSNSKEPEQPATFQEWSAARGKDDASESYRAFKKFLVSLEGTIERKRLEIMDESWYHNESSDAVDTLIENLIDLEPRPTLTDEQHATILRFAKEEDQFQWQRWHTYYDEMGPEKLKQYGIKRPRNLTAEFLDKYPLRHKTSMGLTGLHKFFFVYFFDDALEEQFNVDSALATYLKSERSDPQGRLLLSETDALLARHLTDDELAQIIEIEWDSEVDLAMAGSWTAVLKDIHTKLTANNLSKNRYSEDFDTLATKLIDSLRPSFAAHPDVDEVRLNVILELIYDGEPAIALECLLENLQDMNWEKVVAPISQEQATQLKELLRRTFSDDPAQEQKCIAIVDHVTKHNTSPN